MFFLITFLSLAHAAPNCSVLSGYHLGRTAESPYQCSKEEKFLQGYRIGRKHRALTSEIFLINQQLDITKARQQSLQHEITPAQFNLKLGGFYTKKQVADDYARETSSISDLEMHQHGLYNLAENLENEWNLREIKIQRYHDKWGQSEIDVDRTWRQTITAAGGFNNLKPVTKTTMQSEVKSYAVIGQGLAAIIVGFGTGHALQQRYWKTGWKFTLLDSASIGLIATGNNGSGWIKAAGVLGLLATRTAEAMDVMDRPYISERQVEELQTENRADQRLNIATIYMPVYQGSF